MSCTSERISLFDLHCDTLYELHEKRLPFQNGQTMINARTAANFAPYRQVFALWSNHHETPEEQWARYRSSIEYLPQAGLPQGALLGVEGASLLDGKMERLEQLAADGVRVLTLVWRDECCIGGAYNTSVGFTDFGRAVVQACERLNIIVDYSHASDEMIKEGLSLPGRMICSHSNSREVFGHRRNLRDDYFNELIARGGVVGLSMCGTHIAESPTYDALIDHYEHFLSLGGEAHLCLGCDFDGISSAPAGFVDQSSLLDFYRALRARGHGRETLEKLFYRNAADYFSFCAV